MKKIYLSFLFAGASLAVTAQQAIFPAQEIETKFEMNIPASAAAAGEDTLGLEDFSTSIGITIEASGSGYIFGTSLLDTSVAGPVGPVPVTVINTGVGRGFIVNEAYNVSGAMIWFGLKEGVNASPAALNVTLNALEDEVSLLTPQSSPLSPDGYGPGAELASVALPFDDVDTSSTVLTPTFAFFSSPVWVNSDIAVTIEIEDLYGTEVDTVVVYNEVQETSSGDGTLSWYAQGDIDGLLIPTWIASSALGLEADLAIFAIVVESGVGIEEQGYMNGIKMTTFPNPALSSDNVTIQYGVESDVEKVEINIFDMNGKLMFTSLEGAKTAGLYNLNVPAGALSAGSYIYSVEADRGRMAKRLEILK